MAWYRCSSNGKTVLTPMDFDGIFGKGNVQVTEGRYLFGFSDSVDMGGEDVLYPSCDGAKPVYDRSKPFVLHVRAKCSAQLPRGQCICGNSINYFNMPSIEFQASNSGNVFWAGWSTDGSTWTTSFEIKPNEMPFVANQWYEIDYSWDGTTAKFEVFDGTNTVTKTANVGQFYNTTSGWMMLGTVAKNRNLVASNVTIDLYNTYWEEDGAILWGHKGGDSPQAKLPQVIKVVNDDSGDTKTSYTTESFSVEKGDVILCCVMHRATLTPPTGFSVLKTAYDGQSITVIYKVIDSDATETYTITQSSSVRMSSYWVQLRNAVISDAHIDYHADSTSSFSITTPLRPYYLFLSNVYTGGTWSVSPSEEFLVHSPSGKWLHTLINYGTSWHTSYTLTPPGRQYATIGVFITQE